MSGRSRRRIDPDFVHRFALMPYSGAIPIPKSDEALCQKYVNVTQRVRRVLGLKQGTTLPKDFSVEMKVDGRKVIIKKSGGGVKHRMFIETNKGKMVPTGRLRQAVCTPHRGR